MLYLRSSSLGSGFSLVEVLVSLLLSSGVMVLVLQLYSDSLVTTGLQQRVSQINETGKFSLDYIRHEFQMAGFGGLVTAENIAPVVWPLTTDNGGNFDVVTLQRRATRFGDRTCTGAKTKADALYWTQYEVTPDMNDSSVMQLVCRYAEMDESNLYSVSSEDSLKAGKPSAFKAKGRAVLIAGVRSFQLLYGVKLSDANSSMEQQLTAPTHYLRVDQIDSAAHEVLTVRIGLLLQTAATAKAGILSLGQQHSPALQVLDKQYGSGDNGVSLGELAAGELYRVFQTTVFLQNQSRSLPILLSGGDSW